MEFIFPSSTPVIVIDDDVSEIFGFNVSIDKHSFSSDIDRRENNKSEVTVDEGLEMVDEGKCRKQCTIVAARRRFTAELLLSSINLKQTVCCVRKFLSGDFGEYV
jgi:hypothetical protein